ncbi:MAG: 23S rRNA (adenine(2030)-N(6))-methyltransferase RlmJ, partial [Gammaproteobacteria bacterium]|nr:23S rRNA (adenine(2030)-N(6))-methyltransferase RlmJ [Gammaproteobacteria bacterium]
MNYRHRFHAGNAADIFKHYVLGELLAALATKETPFCVIDTHSGGGLYRLKSPGEFEAGIGRLWPVRAEWPALADLFVSVAAVNGRTLENYPGSPLLIARHLRAQDRAVFIERHAEEAADLRENLRGRPRIAIHEADGYAMLKALVPPPENRGLVFIDPPYEKPDEFEVLAKSLTDACRRW